MIEKMKTVRIVAQTSRKKELLDELRRLGIVHIAEKHSADPAALEWFSGLQRTWSLLADYRTEEKEEGLLSDDEFEELLLNARTALDRRKLLYAERTQAVLALDRLKSWGDFSPSEVRRLARDGIDIHFYRMGKKEVRKLTEDSDVRMLRLSPVEGMEAVAVVGRLPAGFPATEFPMPEKGPRELAADIEEHDRGIAECDAVLKEAASHDASFAHQILKAQNAAEYSGVSETLEGEDGLIWLGGYIPAAEVEGFKAAASKNGWAWAMEDPAEDDEHVPTKIRYNKITRLMIPVFDILGTVPGYREYDISFWFLGFFTLFFAMIIGDAGYGCVFLLAAIGMTLKTRKLGNATLLLFVLSLATIVWGAVTGTWFGLEGAMKVPFLKAMVIPSFANYPQYFEGVTNISQQNAIMKFCFSIGTIQLALACLMNVRRKLPQKDLSFIADIGWLCSICALYFVVLFLVIGQAVNMGTAAAVIVTGFLLVVLFGGMAPGLSFGKGLKAGLGNAFTVFLDTISAFGNIMSYIRLFAVGLASLAIAQSFNNMAAGFTGAGVVAGAAIMFIGHLLNIVMGFLSVIVHGIRLNLLEFSGQLGMEWSGTAYDPFKERDKIRN